MTQLESKQKELEIAILQEKIKKPFLTKEQIRFGIEKFKKLDISTQEGKQRLIDGFINSIYLFDDKLTITFNFKDGSRTVSFSEIEAAKNSDIDCVAAPQRKSSRLRLDFLCFSDKVLPCVFGFVEPKDEKRIYEICLGLADFGVLR